MHASSTGGNRESGIAGFITGLASNDMSTRTRSRESLVAHPSPETSAALVGELYDPRDHVRWEAAKALLEIRDPVTAPAFLDALDDENGDVRWIAAEGLIALGRVGLQAALHGLTKKARSMAFCQSAHHVLRALANEQNRAEVGPVLAALDQGEPAVAAPPAAYKALQKLKVGVE